MRLSIVAESSDVRLGAVRLPELWIIAPTCRMQSVWTTVSVLFSPFQALPSEHPLLFVPVFLRARPLTCTCGRSGAGSRLSSSLSSPCECAGLTRFPAQRAGATAFNPAGLEGGREPWPSDCAPPSCHINSVSSLISVDLNKIQDC